MHWPRCPKPNLQVSTLSSTRVTILSRTENSKFSGSLLLLWLIPSLVSLIFCTMAMEGESFLYATKGVLWLSYFSFNGRTIPSSFLVFWNGSLATRESLWFHCPRNPRSPRPLKILRYCYPTVNFSALLPHTNSPPVKFSAVALLKHVLYLSPVSQLQNLISQFPSLTRNYNGLLTSTNLDWLLRKTNFVMEICIQSLYWRVPAGWTVLEE